MTGVKPIEISVLPLQFSKCNKMCKIVKFLMYFIQIPNDSKLLTRSVNQIISEEHGGFKSRKYQIMWQRKEFLCNVYHLWPFMRDSQFTACVQCLSQFCFIPVTTVGTTRRFI